MITGSFGQSKGINRRLVYSATVLFLGLGFSLTADGKDGKRQKTLQLGVVATTGGCDPNRLGSVYDMDFATFVYDTLYEYEYLARPYRVRPAMAQGMPEVDGEGKAYTIRLKKGIRFIDDPCFEDGRGREATVHDFIYNLYRKADGKTRSTSWWLIDGLIEGLDELREKYTGKEFDYSAKIRGLEAVDDHTLIIRLRKPFPQIMWILAMPSMALYPKEAVMTYGDRFGGHPVGSGPFRLVEWRPGSHYRVVRNEFYRDDFFPIEGTEEDKVRGRLLDAGKPLPLADEVIVREFKQWKNYWTQVEQGEFAWGKIPVDAWNEIFQREGQSDEENSWKRDTLGQRVLTEKFAADFHYYPLPLLDFIYRGFNYEDPIVGGTKGKKLRQALSLAYDPRQANEFFYNGANVIYAGVIPPGVGGFDPSLKNPYQGPNLERARELLAEAGYPGGMGLPELTLSGSDSSSSVDIAAHFIWCAARIGVRIRFDKNSFPELSRKLAKKECQMMGLAWGGDWPDAQNFIQLMYGPNRSPGSNNTNFNHPDVNRLYEKASVLPNSPERNELYRQINEIVIEEVPFIGSMARTRDYLIPNNTLNFKPDEILHNHAKYVRLKSWTE